MTYSQASIAYTAEALIGVHGSKARQAVVDKIVEAVRNHDIDTAHLWDEIGRAVDERLDRVERVM